MFILTVAVSGEITRESVFANVIDAMDEYAGIVNGTSSALIAGEWEGIVAELVSDADSFVSTAWTVPNVASDAGDGNGPTESDTFRVTITRAAATGLDVSPAQFIPSRGIPVPAYVVDLVKRAA